MRRGEKKYKFFCWAPLQLHQFFCRQFAKWSFRAVLYKSSFRRMCKALDIPQDRNKKSLSKHLQTLSHEPLPKPCLSRKNDTLKLKKNAFLARKRMPTGRTAQGLSWHGGVLPLLLWYFKQFWTGSTIDVFKLGAIPIDSFWQAKSIIQPLESNRSIKQEKKLWPNTCLSCKPVRNLDGTSHHQKPPKHVFSSMPLTQTTPKPKDPPNPKKQREKLRRTLHPKPNQTQQSPQPQTPPHPNSPLAPRLSPVRNHRDDRHKGQRRDDAREIEPNLRGVCSLAESIGGPQKKAKPQRNSRGDWKKKTGWWDGAVVFLGFFAWFCLVLKGRTDPGSPCLLYVVPSLREVGQRVQAFPQGSDPFLKNKVNSTTIPSCKKNGFQKS